MENIDISKYSRYSLELILSEADKMANQLLKSLSENVNKSFVLFAIYSSIFSYSFIKITESPFLADSQFLYSILLIGSVISCVVIHKNLFPTKVIFNGSLPEKMIDPYFDSFKDDDLDKEYLATQIQSYNFGINMNHKTIEKMVGRFYRSVWVMISSFLLFAIFIVLVKGMHT